MRCRANRWPKAVQNVRDRDTKTRANFRNCGKLCTETECEDATLEGQESTCGNRQKCPIFKHLVLVVPEERLDSFAWSHESQKWGIKLALDLGLLKI